MRYAHVATVLVTVAVAAYWLNADADPPRDLKIVISERSIQVGDIELSGDPSVAPYISLPAAEKALGEPHSSYRTEGVHVYAWRGIHLLKSFHRPEGMIFKFQVWFDDNYDKEARKHSGKFGGHVQSME